MSVISKQAVLPHSNNQAAGWMLRACALIGIIFMLMHPEINAPTRATAIAELIEESSTARFVHGALIVTIMITLFTVERFAQKLHSYGIEADLGLAFYRFGCFAFIFAALISGFVMTDLGVHYAAKPLDEQSVFFDLARLAETTNRALSKLASVFNGLAALAWGIGMIRLQKITRLIGLGFIVIGAIIVSAIMLGLKLNVQGMTLVVVGLSLWQAMMAWLLVKPTWL
jgi:hypothetical protein